MTPTLIRIHGKDRFRDLKNLISIVTPVYNKEPWLAETIGSVLAQSYANWELWLIDDGSTDHSGGKSAMHSDARTRVCMSNTS